MTSLIKTYITDAPWGTILSYGLLFGLLVGGLQVLLRYKTTGAYFTGTWYSELAMWFTVGIFVKYSTWRAESYLDRKNKKWASKRKSVGTK